MSLSGRKGSQCKGSEGAKLMMGPWSPCRHSSPFLKTLAYSRSGIRYLKVHTCHPGIISKHSLFEKARHLNLSEGPRQFPPTCVQVGHLDGEKGISSRTEPLASWTWICSPLYRTRGPRVREGHLPSCSRSCQEISPVCIVWAKELQSISGPTASPQPSMF